MPAPTPGTSSSCAKRYSGNWSGIYTRVRAQTHLMRIVVVGGGTATNSITPVFSALAHDISYVVPVSDNGGSTSEILRVFGGPAIGDARSRLVRLIDPSPLHTLLAMRLSNNAQLAEQDWNAVVDGTHTVWTEVPPYMKSMYRAFLIEVHAQLLKKTTTMRKFDFSCASIGNLLLTGARLFFGTLESAIEFVLHTNRVPANLAVLPCINSSFSHHIAATLQNGSIVVGQSQISHPIDVGETHHGAGGGTHNNGGTHSSGGGNLGRMGSIHRRARSHIPEDDGVLFSHPSLQISQIQFAKDTVSSLPSRIDQVYYINTYGDEIRPKISPRVITHLQTSDAVILSIGSLYTSILPVLLLQGFATNMPRKCVLILNGSPDRETEGMNSQDYVYAVQRALEYSLGSGHSRKNVASFITDIIYPHNLADIASIDTHAHIRCVGALCPHGEYNQESLLRALETCITRV